ncbi:MAG: hypothetical protein JKY84_07810 [Emcibacteraceae bacterium]|nr:hypothetical protein [Emcibacteraceae bacterium]
MFKNLIFKGSLLTLMVASFSVAVNAHEAWLERDGSGPVRVYMGPAEGPHPGHGKEIDVLKNVEIFTQNRNNIAKLSRKNDHFEAADVGDGDARMFSDQIWQPWENRDGQMQGAVFQARAGRSEAVAKLDYEIVPVSQNSNIFTVIYKGQPVAGNHVMVVTPGKWQKNFTVDAAGRVEVPMTEKGRYILISDHDVVEDREISGQQVKKVTYISTISFVAK